MFLGLFKSKEEKEAEAKEQQRLEETAKKFAQELERERALQEKENRRMDFWRRRWNGLLTQEEESEEFKKYETSDRRTLIAELQQDIEEIVSKRSELSELFEQWQTLNTRAHASKDYESMQPSESIKNEYFSLEHKVIIEARKLLPVLKKLLVIHLSELLNDDEWKEIRDEFDPTQSCSDILLFLRKLGTYNFLVKNGYLPVLKRKKKQLIYHDEYGDLRLEKFDAELDNFVVRRDLSDVNASVFELLEPELVDLVKDLDFLTATGERHSKATYDLANKNVDQMEEFEKNSYGETQFRRVIVEILALHQEEDLPDLAEELSNESNSEQQISPYEYEERVGNKFRILGWNSQVTKGSGDQGADVIIKKGNHVGVVQCKMYSQPVGNKAVQEVHAAKSYYDGTFAVVVSNQDYTPSARMLATKLGVYLIHDSDIRDFSELFLAP